MKLEFTDGLLFSNVTITHNGKSITIQDIVIDTGAAESLISIDAVGDLFESYEPNDEIRFMTGIGGREASIRRKIHQIKFNSFVVENFHIDFGRIGDYSGINGLIGLDVLIPGKFIIDLNQLNIYQADPSSQDL